MSSVAAPHVLNIEDLRRLAARRAPRVVFDYLDGGAEAEVTLRANVRAFEALTFRPRGAVAIPEVDIRITVMGARLALPFILAPVGSTRMFYPRGEELAAHAAGAAGTAYILSTLSGTNMEDVQAATKGPAWYQVYLVGGRDIATAMLQRARKAGFTALVLTIDTPVSGMREKDLRNGTKELLGRGPSRPWPRRHRARSGADVYDRGPRARAPHRRATGARAGRPLPVGGRQPLARTGPGLHQTRCRSSSRLALWRRRPGAAPMAHAAARPFPGES